MKNTKFFFLENIHFSRIIKSEVRMFFFFNIVITVVVLHSWLVGTGSVGLTLVRSHCFVLMVLNLLLSRHWLSLDDLLGNLNSLLNPLNFLLVLHGLSLDLLLLSLFPLQFLLLLLLLLLLLVVLGSEVLPPGGGCCSGGGGGNGGCCGSSGGGSESVSHKVVGQSSNEAPDSIIDDWVIVELSRQLALRRLRSIEFECEDCRSEEEEREESGLDE